MGDVSFCAMQFPTPEKHTSQDEDASDPSRTTIRRWEKRDLPSRTLSWLAHGAKGPASWLSSPAEACSRALLVRGLAAFCGAVRCGAAAHSAVPEESHHGVVVVGLGLGVRAQGYGLAQVPGPPVITTIDVVKTETGDLFPRSKGSSVQPCKVSNSPGSTPTLRHYDCADPLFVDKSHAGAASWHGFHFHVFAWQSPGALTSWCQVARHTPPPRTSSSCTPHPYQPIVTIPEVPVPTVKSPSASASQLHPTQMQPPWGLGKGFWVLPPCPPSHMPASLHAAVFGWDHCAQKSRSSAAWRTCPCSQGGVTIGQRLPSSGPVSSSDTWGHLRTGSTLSRENALRPSYFILRLGP